ncbi:MAG: 2-octaprenyl-6-methoxyphenyl hydroxylase [Lysobacterales bacterium]
MTQPFECDVAIVGSGLVGSALACALDGTGMNVALIEAQAPRGGSGREAPQVLAGPALDQPAPDQRNLALGRRSVESLERIGVWQHAAVQGVPIREVHVSRRGDFGKLHLGVDALNLDAFGHTVPAPVLGEALESRLRACGNLRRLQPARLEGWRSEHGKCLLEVLGPRGSEEIGARLIVAADGTESGTRERAGITVTRRDYAQTAIVGSVALGREHEGRAFERFLDNGLVAMLPLAGRFSGFVWAMPMDDAPAAMSWDDASFMTELQSVFGSKLGAFKRIGKRQAWPLRALTAQSLCAERLVLVGNAAQTLHPVGAQGFNLGLRDAITLAEEIVAAHREGRDIGSDNTLQRFARRRKSDRDATVATSDALIGLFGSSNAAIRFARSAALAAVERLPFIKRGLARRGMGYRREGAP